MKFFIIGSRELVLAFKLVGVDGIAAENRTDILEAFNKVTGKGVKTGSQNDETLQSIELPKVLILTEDAAVQIEEEEIAWQKTGKFPLIVEIPTLNGHIEGKKSLSDAVKEAIGVDV